MRDPCVLNSTLGAFQGECRYLARFFGYPGGPGYNRKTSQVALATPRPRVGADNEARTEDNYLKFRLGSLKRLRRVGRLPGRVHPRFLARSTQGGASRNIQKKTRVYTARFSTFSSLERNGIRPAAEPHRKKNEASRSHNFTKSGSISTNPDSLIIS